jgi:hypothetical protein
LGATLAAVLASGFCWTPSAAAAGKPQKVEFTSTPPEPGLVGSTYTPTATATSELAVVFTIAGGSASQCSLSAEGRVEFKAPGPCVIVANQSGSPEWEPAPEKTQEVQVKRPQTITFTTQPPEPAIIGGSYSPKAEAISQEAVVLTVDSASGSVCSMAEGRVRFEAVGTCTIDASQTGNAQWAPAPQATQSFAVVAAPIVTVVPGPTPKPPPPPPPPPPAPTSGNSNFKAGLSSFEPKTGRVIFYETITDPGTFKWLLTVPNGKFGVFASARKKCNVGLVRLNGGCRPARVIFATGSASVPAGLVIFKLRPSPNALKALKNALKRGRGLLVTATFTFQSSRGGSPVTRSQTLRVKLKK